MRATKGSWNTTCRTVTATMHPVNLEDGMNAAHRLISAAAHNVQAGKHAIRRLSQ